MFKKLFIPLFAIFLLFTPSVNAKEYLARVTYYWGDGITSLGKKPICGKTLAVDPKIIPYGSIVKIPQMGGSFISSDTGSAVRSRLAAKKLGKPQAIVVDVFCSSLAVARQRIKKYPMFMKVIVEKKK